MSGEIIFWPIPAPSAKMLKAAERDNGDVMMTTTTVTKMMIPWENVLISLTNFTKYIYISSAKFWLPQNVVLGLNSCTKTLFS